MSNSTCIDADPDITGIGVRTAVYAQTIFSLIPALRILSDGRVTPNELDAIEEQSATILVTAFALLFTTIIQARGHSGLSNFHATIILNLSWMNNTNLFIYLLIYVYHITETARKRGTQTWNLRILREEAKKINFKNPVFWIGSLHLTLMGAIGIWLWSSPETFGHSPSCALNASVVFLGKGVSLSSKGLRVWSILIYSILLTPILNMILPSAAIVLVSIYFFQPSQTDHPEKPKPKNALAVSVQTFWRSTQPVRLGLLLLLCVNIFFIINTELALTENRELLGDGDGDWTFGQVLALMLLLVTAWNFVGILLERKDARQKKIKNLVSKTMNGGSEQARKLLDEGAGDNAKDLALVLAAAIGDHLETVKVLYESPRLGEHFGGQLAFLLAVYQKRYKIIEWLAIQPLDIKSQKERIVEPFGSLLSEREVEPFKSSLSDSPSWLDFGRILADLSLGINVEAKEVMDALGKAAERGLQKVFNGLALGVQDVHSRNEAKQTPLHLVAKHGTLQGAEYLIGKGARIDAVDDSGMTPLHLAVSRGAQDIVQCLIDHDYFRRVLLIFENDSNFVKRRVLDYYKNHMVVNLKDKNGQTPLHLAASRGFETTVKVLVERGADVNAKDSEGKTPSQVALETAHHSIVEFLSDKTESTLRKSQVTPTEMS